MFPVKIRHLSLSLSLTHTLHHLSVRGITAIHPSQSMQPSVHQHVVVMRHGDRIDNFEPLWASTAARKWDPPLVEAGRVRAFCTARKLRNHLDFPIHRIFVSPFLRCLQTAYEAVSALCAVDDDPNHMSSADGVTIDPSKLKVHVEYGLCEMLNKEAIRLEMAPKDGNFEFNISDCEALLPAGTVDSAVERVYEKLPQWEETVTGARARYVRVIKALADKYPSENLLLVTHGEGVGVSVSAFLKEVTVYEVEYCAYSHLKRPIIFKEDQSFTAGDFEVLIKGQTGISLCPTSTPTDDPLNQPNSI
ncbi:hypothetical protein RJ639_004155 [Escallonia herrerae]|uniref:Uncharacterized protein n=1 Tax=Escallonia herrerae TaxID=1293975 RepID=A0AA89AXZ2_9ASTE|nr:hypothetical protein RJ639_004155 [Escallonia herrerae]